MGEAELAHLLRETSAAHSYYESDVLHGVRDEHWAAWYAGYMIDHGAGSIPGWPAGARTPESAAALLAEADKSHRSNAPQEDWPEYYALYILRGEGLAR